MQSEVLVQSDKGGIKQKYANFVSGDLEVVKTPITEGYHEVTKSRGWEAIIMGIKCERRQCWRIAWEFYFQTLRVSAKLHWGNEINR